jgi:hypothetical protein
MTLAIGHREGDRVVLDAIRERRPPFSPEDVVREFSEVLKAYQIKAVRGDKYAGEWPRERFRLHGVDYEVAERTKGEYYQGFLPVINSKRVDLLDHTKLITQFCNLERRTGRSGKDSIDHSPGSHDDIANSVAALAVELSGSSGIPGVLGYYRAMDEAQKKREEVNEPWSASNARKILGQRIC